MSKTRPSEAELAVIRSALHRAYEERISLAEAYGNQGPEGKQALALAAKYRTLLNRWFGVEPQLVQLAKNQGEGVNILELMAGPKK